MKRLPALLLVFVLGLSLSPSKSHAQPQGDRVRTLVDTLQGGVGGVAVDRSGIIYAADFRDQVFRITPSGEVSVFATGLYGSSGNTIDSNGNLLQSSFFGNYISRIDRNGNAETFAEGLNGPVGIAIDPDDQLVVCNCANNTLSRVTAEGDVSLFVESPLLNCPNGVTRGPDGNYYVVNFSNEKMLKVTPAGEISEFATLPGGGNGHVTVARGALVATSFQGNRVYRVTLDGDVSLLAGTGAFGQQDGAGKEATFIFPNGIAAGPNGDRVYINDFINRFPPTVEAPPAPLSSLRQITLESLSGRLTTALQSGGLTAMTEAYQEWKANPATAPLYTEIEVNAMGYQLMNNGQLDLAIALFKLNVDSYPQSFNVYDSLGEAYMNAGQKKLAIEFYEKSIEINPANTNGVSMLEKLRSE